MKTPIFFWNEHSSNLSLEFERELMRRYASPRKQIGSWLEGMLNWAAGKHEPRIRQRRDRSGQLFWQVYDPDTNHSASFSSEAEVRIWLEQRYAR